MLIKRIEGETRALGAPANWDGTMGERCNILPIRDTMTQNGPFMVSAWEPTPDELEALRNGATVKLWVAGRVHPVVAVTVGDIENTAEDTAL
jgi:hypothetical protein